MEAKKKLYRSLSDKKLLGVCGGFAEYFDVDSTVMRLIFLFLVLCCGVGVLGYLICALVMPAK
ncbi:MAG: PspC domain-containing protein [Bacteroidaceae bacterium]|nr:PspC domain-containing protein [Bacteroidaceae bacterium]